ncbi:MAG: hypothetical protein ABSB35_20380 [Bryobacteraceae bacterium]|jgi:hypothetical protein
MIEAGETRHMNRTVTLTSLALAAGLLGGLLSRYIDPAGVFAQAPTPALRKIRAQSFVLVNAQGVPLGLIGIDPQGWPIIKLMNEQGTTLWSTRAHLLSQDSK